MSVDKKRAIQALIQSNRHAEAIPLLQSICASSPNNAEAHYLLGCAYARLGQNDEAVTILQRCLRLAPNVAQTHFALAGVWLAQDLPNEAATSLEAALKINNAIPEIHVELAKIQIANRDLSNARSHLEQALKLNPQMSDVHFGLGRLEQEIEDHEKAMVHLKKALQYNPQSAQALCGMGASMIGLARTINKVSVEDAEIYYRKALEIEPGYIDAIAGLAIVYDFSGDYKKAAELIEPLLEKGIRHATVAVAFARICRYVGQCQEAIDCVEKVLKKPGLSASTRKGLYFASAKVFDNMGDYEAAFERYKAANEVIGVQAYNTVDHACNIKEIIKVFNPGLFMQLPPASSLDTRPIFIVGMPSSGTSLIEQILAAHPEVYGAGELTALGKIIANMPRRLNCEQRFPTCMGKLDQEIIDSLSRAYLQELSKQSGRARRITDKMPHNFYFLGLIQLLFPGAKVIHCQRDPMDTCLSIYFQDFNDLHDYARDLFKVGTHYYQYERLMEHWKQILSVPILDVSYEEVVSDQEAVTRRMLEFCELEWDDNCLRFYQLRRTVNTPSYEQVRQPIYTKSVGRWRHYEQFLDPLKAGLQRGL